MTELLNCPFCGEAEAERNSDRWGHFYVCNCGARAAYGSTPADALQAWNHRGTLAQGQAECACSRAGFPGSCYNCDAEASDIVNALRKLYATHPICQQAANYVERLAERAPIGLADIERVIVDYFDAAGFEVVEGNSEWIAHVDDAEVFVTAIAVAIHSSIGRQSPAVKGDEPVAWVRSTHGGYSMELSKHVAYKLPEGIHPVYAKPQSPSQPETDALRDQIEELRTCLHEFVFKEAVRDETIERAKRALSAAKFETVGEEELTEAIDNCADSLGTAIDTSDIARGLLSHFEVRRK